MTRVAAAIAGFVVAATAVPLDAAADFSGRVLFNGLAVPGVVVTALRTNTTIATSSDESGVFRFANLDDGAWKIRVEMTGFVSQSHDVTLPLEGPPIAWTLELRPPKEIAALQASPTTAGPQAPPSPSTPPTANPVDLVPPEVITGSSINGAATPVAQPRAFGNNRPTQARPYSFSVNTQVGDSSWNARPFSFSGSAGPAPDYSDIQAGVTMSGPLRVPWLIRSNATRMVLSYERSVSYNAGTQSAVMPSHALRAGDFSQSTRVIRDPVTGQPFAGNVIPAARITPTASALLALYPLPNTDAGPGAGANFQTPVVTGTTRDNLQLNLTRIMRAAMTMSARVGWQRAAGKSDNLFDFHDRTRQTSLTAALNWSRTVSRRVSVNASYQFTRSASAVIPFFANRTNVSGDAGIAGNDQDPANWGPPTLLFPDIADLRDAPRQRTVTKTHAAGGQALLRRGSHNITIGADVRWTLFDAPFQPDPRGTLTFTGAATGDAFADFLLGLPTASSIALGNTGTRLRGTTYDAYFTDDFRLRAGLTLNIGVRWEYEAPFTEASGHLVNLDVAPGFAAIGPVLATDPVGALTGASYPTSLIRPDKRGFEPRLAASWRPSLQSSLVFRAGYGVYRNLGSYQPLALLLAQQPPYSRTFSVQHSPETPLTLAHPFPETLPRSSNTFAVDPGLRTAAAENWQLSAQRELPASLTVLVAYLGARGSHLMQAFVPNTYPAGAVNPCPVCPSGFVYVTSNGRSIRHAAQFTLRRRLYQGFMASAQYTYSKASDDAATFSNRAITPSSLAVAQNWLDLGAERGPSSFDQRHLVTADFQYTTGVGLGGSLISGVWGTLTKDWTLAGQFSAGSGLPFTPVAFTVVGGTGLVGIRPRLTGVSSVPVAPGSYANGEAFAPPEAGAWGDAGRHSIRGPGQLSLDMSLSRVIRFGGRVNLDWRVSVNNVLNRVQFTAINTVISSPLFGRPTSASSMRTVRMTARFRF